MWCQKVPNGMTPKGNPKFKYEPLRSAPVYYCSDHPEKPAVDVVSPATGNPWAWRKKLGRFLPKWASRITLEVVGVRVERLQEISEADAKAEGVPEALPPPSLHHLVSDGWEWQPFTTEFRGVWEDCYGPGSWDANPWVWVVEFKPRVIPSPKIFPPKSINKTYS